MALELYNAKIRNLSKKNMTHFSRAVFFHKTSSKNIGWSGQVIAQFKTNKTEINSIFVVFTYETKTKKKKT